MSRKSFPRLVVKPFSSILFFFFILASEFHFVIGFGKNLAFGLKKIFIAAVPKADVYILVPNAYLMLLIALPPAVGKLSGDIVGNGNEVGFIKVAEMF